jgi:hypothetical protein
MIGRRGPLLLAALLLGAVAVPGLAEKLRNHFDSDAPLRPPAFFDFAVVGADARAEWMVLADRNSPSAPNQVTQTVAHRPQGSVALALRRNASLRDGGLSVTIKKGASSAGLVFRMADEKDYLLLLIDSASGSAVLTATRGGATTDLARGKIEADRDWGILAVELSGREVRASWNEKELLRGSDAKPVAGRVGLAAADRASFDELVIDGRETGEGGR